MSIVHISSRLLSTIKHYVAYGSAILLPLLIAFILVFLGNSLREPFDPPLMLWNTPQLEPVQFVSVEAMESYFQQISYIWIPAPGASVPLIELSTIPAGIGQVKDVSRKKSIFFRILLPLVIEENNFIQAQRSLLLKLSQKLTSEWSANERLWFLELLTWYRLSEQQPNPALFTELLSRVDSIPTDLVLAQAANESGWGTSRFARAGNNLFGMWTYDEKKGLIPKNRAKGEKHAVRIFSSLRDSVRVYMRNLNTHTAYQLLRDSRALSRSQGKEPEGWKLAPGLLKYSSRGKNYVAELQSMIKGNQLALVTLLSLRLAAVTHHQQFEP
ncbi:hypothetical protein MNBD_GAMMA16-1156 [hydrothermal vent metagenome]|uniref:Mannosyl-glycoprotein endo-beta-N-acetylglucosamidase-like domain-containing protein n=1 Tax=hydrothermal vent metagenome TaxID=652676 RepID=A0A3B0Z8N2_9ZZZZ